SATAAAILAAAPRGSRRKRGEWAQAVGRSRGGRTSKIHFLADDRGRPIAFALTPGNVADISMALPLLGAVTPPKHLIADKAYARIACATGLDSVASRLSSHPQQRGLFRTRAIAQSIDVATSSS